MSDILDRRLVLSGGCRVTADEHAVSLTTREDEYRLATSDTAALAELLAALQCPSRPRDVVGAGQAHVSLGEALGQLRAHGLLLDVDVVSEAVGPDDTVRALQDEARFWARPIFEQPFWSDLLSGSCSHAQILGWGVEFFHFVQAADVYMPLGVANARRHRGLRSALCRHYLEEVNHGAIFLDGLERSGLDRRSVLAAPPLPHTSALINALVEFAHEGDVAYAATFAVMQPGFDDAESAPVEAFYDELRSLYPDAAPMFDAFQRHAQLDVDLGHDATVLAQLCHESASIDAGDRARATQVMRAVAESFILFFEGIHDTWAGERRFVPRLPLVLAIDA